MKKTFPCNQCPNALSDGGHLKRHLRIHIGENEFCDYKATKKGSLQQHVKFIHDGVKHNCEFCDHKATQKGSLQ